MKKIVKRIASWPLHLILLPVYFIVNKSLLFEGLLDRKELIIAFLKIAVGISLLYGLFYLLYKDRHKAAVASSITAILYLFFGDIKVSMSQLPLLHYLSHYKVFIPLAGLVLLTILYFIRKAKSITRLNTYFTLLILIYFLADIFLLKLDVNNKNRLKVTGSIIASTKSTDTSPALPNIYYIVPDGYPSFALQQEALNMQHDFLDSSLTAKGFYIANGSKSNYSNTAFSMASVFAMNYLMGVDSTHVMAPYYYNRSMQLVKSSPFLTFLESRGYSLYNLSIFDLKDEPALEKDRFLSATTSEILFYGSFYNCIKRDLFWQLVPGYLQKQKDLIKKSRRKVLYPQKEYNRRVADSLLNFTPSNDRQPFFLYAHIKMPHFPYFYDSSGRALPDDSVFAEPMIKNNKRFAGYIHYSNQQINKLISQLLLTSKGQDIIIIQSDHGTDDVAPFKKEYAFQNFSAFYFPDRDYKLLQENITNVNTFRVILNKYFGQQLPMLENKHFYLK